MNNPIDNPLHKAGIKTGARRLSETGVEKKIRIRDINFDKGSGVVIGKGNKQRVVWLNREVVPHLERWLALRGLGAPLVAARRDTALVGALQTTPPAAARGDGRR